jgi:hypothetical protein
MGEGLRERYGLKDDADYGRIQRAHEDEIIEELA